MKNTYGIPFSKALFNAVEDMRQWSSFQADCFASNVFNHGYSDFFYVHHQDAEVVNEVFSYMYKHRVFLELAVPAALNCVRAQVVPDCNHFINMTQKRALHYHPIKFSNRLNQHQCIGRIDNPNHVWEIETKLRFEKGWGRQ